jgi:hypothetical protein
MAQAYGSPDEVRPILFDRSRVWTVIAVVLLFALGLGIRLYDLTDPPLDFHPTRQLHSMMIARGIYYENLESAPQWQRDLAVRQWKAEMLLEPPIVENLAALSWRIAGAEYLWLPRIFSILFWLMGAGFLYWIARDLTGANGGVIALAYMLLLPYAAIASRSFQPEPLMITSIIAAWWGMLRWYRRPTWKRALIAGGLAGWAIFVKSVAIFFIAPAWLGLILGSMTLGAALRSKQVWAMALLTVIPYAIYHVYGVYITGMLASQFTLRFFPALLQDPAFFLRWNGMITRVFSFEGFLAAVLGLFAIRERAPRAMFLSILAGYFIYGLVFTYAISTHDYYQEPIIPLVALGFAGGLSLLLPRLGGPRWLVSAAAIGLLLFFVTIKTWDVRVTLKRDDYRAETVFWQKLGKQLGNGSSVVGLLHDYGYRLAYWGWIQPTNWMTSGDFNFRALDGRSFDMEQLFEEQTEGKDFFVVTLFSDYERQPKLRSLLERNYPVLVQEDDYLIFDLRHKK